MTAARRTPAQARSREMVERIVAAAEAVLADHGYGGMSTNRVAAAAGVSPGSLYQYFANKDDLVAEISRRLVEQFNDALTPALRRAAATPSEQGLRTAIETVLAALQERARLLRALVDRTPPAEQAIALGEVRRRLNDGIYSLLTAQDPSVSSRQAEASSWLIAEISEHLAVRFILDEPPLDRESFVDSLLQVIAALSPA